jgi:hypothetical protein
MNDRSTLAARIDAHASGALAAQKSLQQLMTVPDCENVLQAAIVDGVPSAGEAEREYLRGFLRVVEKALR